MWISWCCINTFNCFIGTTYDFFSNTRYFWEELKEEEKDIWIKFSSSAPTFKQYQDY